ncbi:MAG: phage head-tail adapter protein, partial [Verrucomicrobia bacterium]|nr:phage head-tail adapter protein [Verrucomicrobiota bacterium]
MNKKVNYRSLWLVGALAVIPALVGCQSARTTAQRPPMQTSKLFVQLPDFCPTPDGMAIAPDGDLVVACPN